FCARIPLQDGLPWLGTIPSFARRRCARRAPSCGILQRSGPLSPPFWVGLRLPEVTVFWPISPLRRRALLPDAHPSHGRSRGSVPGSTRVGRIAGDWTVAVSKGRHGTWLHMYRSGGVRSCVLLCDRRCR